MSANEECLDTSLIILLITVISMPHVLLRGPHMWCTRMSRASDDAVEQTYGSSTSKMVRRRMQTFVHSKYGIFPCFPDIERVLML